VSSTEERRQPSRGRSLVHEVLGAQLAVTALAALIAVAGLAWTSGSVVRDNLERWAGQWASELNELGAPFYLDDAGAALLDIERFIAKFPEIERVTWYDQDGAALLSLDAAGHTEPLAPALDSAATLALAERVGAPTPYLLTGGATRGQKYRLSGPIWTETLGESALFAADPVAAASAPQVLGFVGVDLDFSTYESALWPRLAVASAALALLLGGWWFVGRWFLKSAFAPLSELQTSLAELARGETNVRFPSARHTELGTIVTALEDTTLALRRREQRLLHLANHDQLTGLPNRHRFVAELDAELARATPTGARGALFFIDLDQFKYVNDTCGHASGDHLLTLAAQQLRYALRPQDLLARFGGDEFVVLARDVSRHEAKALALKVLELMRGLKHVERERVFPLQCSIGVTAFHGSRVSSHELIAQADIACQSAKNHGRNRVELYSQAGKQSEQISKDLTLMNRLREALDEDRFELHYQPLMHIASGTIAHYEALLRLPTESGLVGPDAFLPAAVRFGLMAEIDRWTLRHAVGALAALGAAGQHITLGINLSGFAFEDEGLPGFLRSVLLEQGVAGERVVLEITEQLAVRFAAATDRRIGALRELGCRLAIDDFGSGYSSFSYLKQLPVDYLKIDGAFVKSLARDRVDQAMVRMVAEVARAAGIQTVAEYVQSAATLELLAKYRIDYAQGYHIGKPSPSFGGIERAEQRAVRTR
jgi:diguanylate cyclase (GGDEF)-like protein